MEKFEISDFVVTSQARQELKEARKVVNGCSDNGHPSQPHPTMAPGSDE